MNTRQWLEKLVAFDTTSRNSNLELINTVKDYLDSFGLQSWLTMNPEGNKANLFATLPASNGETQGGIVLSGHTDVVPVDGQDWHTNPFQLVEKDGLLYGRGTCDMKGFIASALALLPEWTKQQRNKPIHFALSYDEEVGCAGAPVMIDELKKRGQQVDGCVVGEPTSMRVVVAHKGINLFTCKVHGKAAHSSLTPRGCNAIEHAARLICHIRDLADYYRQQGPFDDKYDVPFTTMTTNLIEGGIAVNTIPEACTFKYEFRNLPGIPVEEIQSKVERYVQEELLPRMQKEFPDAKVEITANSRAPGLEASEKAAITALVRALTRDNEVRKVAYGTEAGLFEQIGIPTIVCGPGNIEQAHKPNEFISLEQLDECDNFLRKLVASL
ncbi:acetylornithine deacetylase [Pelistega suis]|uniref:Probable succinyl-diaminopimelate desuccinylase n=1 Tax=Pelistega suis TaxID=1631957 RepID=A0A849P3J9_9BURK|nr:acetylornithine deacetylase [Pelistega suis]NOL51626.1 acetylornithine deacetylase [Pelistega suis]